MLTFLPFTLYGFLGRRKGLDLRLVSSEWRQMMAYKYPLPLSTRRHIRDDQHEDVRNRHASLNDSLYQNNTDSDDTHSDGTDSDESRNAETAPAQPLLNVPPRRGYFFDGSGCLADGPRGRRADEGSREVNEYPRLGQTAAPPRPPRGCSGVPPRDATSIVLERRGPRRAPARVSAWGEHRLA